MRHCRASEARIPSPMASRCMAAPSGVISARLARLARCLSAFATADIVWPERVRRTAQSPWRWRLLALSSPTGSLLIGRPFFTQDTAAEPEKSEASRTEHRRLGHLQLFERLGPEVESFWSSTSSRRAGRWVRAPSLSSPKSCLSPLPFTLQHTSYPCTHPLHQSLPLPFARGRPIARDRRRS